MEFIGVGDLHLDGKLSKYIPNLNEVILNEVRTGPIRHAERNGINLVVFYGDICDIPHMSTEATIGLIRMFTDHPRIKFLLITGNHDMEYAGKHSLLLLKELCDKGALQNVRIFDQPTTLFRKQGTPLRLLPWPSFELEEDALNVIHVEVNGSQWDHGKAVESERESELFCVGGHLHTKQRVRNIHYSGTLYQTNFGEKPDKYFHHVKMAEGEEPVIELIPHKPKYALHNLVVSSPEDLAKVVQNQYNLYKVFVKSGADISAESLQNYPNVVKINAFKNRKELMSLLSEELLMQDTEVTVNDFTVMEALQRWMVRANIKERTAERAVKVLQDLLSNSKES